MRRNDPRDGRDGRRLPAGCAGRPGAGDRPGSRSGDGHASADVVARIPELWQALNALFETDLKLLDVITLARIGTTLEPSKVHGLVLSSNVLKDYTTPDGASVLVVRDPAQLEAVKATLFEAKPLSDLGKAESSECP